MPRARSPRFLAQSLALALFCSLLSAQTATAPRTEVEPVRPQGYTLEPATVDLARPPIQQDTGKAAFDQLMRKLKTTARLMHCVAHPDDEDGGMMTLESRGKGASTLLFTLTRGEGGQNKTGSNLFDELGVLRTLELLESDRYYGVDQRFSRVADFGFSKTPQESLSMWAHEPVAEGAMPPDEHNPGLADMVRAIRIFRPDVLTSRFTGAEKTSHGHHQAAGLLTREAFKAAGDPRRFPEQIAEGLLPWQPLKLYVGAREGGYTVQFDVGANDAVLGTSYIGLSMQGLRHQMSQGAADWSVTPGPHWTKYSLADKAAGMNPSAQEQDYFDGIDTTLPGLYGRLSADGKSSVPWIKDALMEIAKRIDDAAREKDMAKAAKPLLTAATQMDDVFRLLSASGLADVDRAFLLTNLREKRQELYEAANLAMGVTLETFVAPPGGPSAAVPEEKNSRVTVSPGQTVMLVVKFRNGSQLPLQISGVRLSVPETWIAKQYVAEERLVQPGEEFYANYQLRIPATAALTRPLYYRNNPETDTVWKVQKGAEVTKPLPPAALSATVEYKVYKAPSDWNFGLFGMRSEKTKIHPQPGSQIASVAVASYRDKDGHEHARPVAVVPQFSVLMEPSSQVIPVSASEAREVAVRVRSNTASATRGEVSLEAPEGWNVEPSRQPVSLDATHREQRVTFTLTPNAHTAGAVEVRAKLVSRGTYSEGQTTVSRDDLGTFYYYQSAIQRVSVVDVQVPAGLKIGYIMGAGDVIPTVLQQLGLQVEMIAPEKLASIDLQQFGTVVLGIRAYDTREEVRKNNSRLLEYVQNGGTLIVQYNADWSEFNAGKYTPYPASMSRDRVSVENAPVQVLAPQDSIFNTPNKISGRDFDGWVQERGLYFLSEFDKQYTPLLSCNDPGEPPRNGGLLRASYGKGTYIYTGYAFFRQLPNGVAGATRLFVNLLAAGHTR